MYIKIILATIFLSCLSLSSQAQEEHSDQYDLDTAAYNQYKSSAVVLDSVVNALMVERKDDTLYIRNFKKAQKLWLQFRDAQLEAQYPVERINSMGSIRPMCYNYYRQSLTEDRIQEIKSLLTHEEGDVCDY